MDVPLLLDHAFDFFAVEPVPGLAEAPDNQNGWIEWDVPLGGEMDEPMKNPGMCNLEYRHRELVKKIEIVSDAEVADSIVIREIHPRVTTLEGQVYENFSKIAKPLTLLTQKNKTYVWGDKQDEAFCILKEKLRNAPVLALLDGPNDFVVYCDASKKGFGCVVMQQGKVIAYASRQLKTHEKNYTTHDLELVGGIRKLIMDEAHTSRYSVHLGADKMYYDLKDLYWRPGMKRDIAEYVSMCHTCSKVKVEHQKPSGLLQQLEIPEWKWKKLKMDLVTKFPRSSSGYDAIWVIVDRLTKSGHFLTIHEDYKTDKLVRIYINKIVARHGVPVSIISDHDGRFASHLWQALQEVLGTKLHMSTAYHPETDGQSEHTIQTLEDMLRACVMDFGGKKIIQIKERLKTERSRQKSYADKRRKPLEFKVRDRVLLKVLSWKGVVRFGKKGKMEPRVRCEKKLKQRRIPLVKVRWNSRQGAEYTWEREDQFRKKYPHLFTEPVPSSSVAT
uniref:Putative reverse transcriptase domain-containing protein n=1 Tax=Tanacetum cinerariifolium TaxID=118510 RepID=A0A6L2LWT4_TANCI|nr:putative reverse transcriptase domain-containing protein [Tanacetum cinerariifolium]